MFVRKFVCYVMVFAIGIGSVGNLFAGWTIWSISFSGSPSLLTTMFEVERNRHWSYTVSEKVSETWYHRGGWGGSAHPTDVAFTHSMTRAHAGLTNIPATCRSRLFDLGPVGPPQTAVEKDVWYFSWL